MLKTLHFSLAFLSVAGFVIRAGWSYGGSDLLQEKWVKIAPHVVDTLLLTLGVVLAFSLPEGSAKGWLLAKLIALVAYVGFGVMTLRGRGVIRHIGLAGALLSVGYIFLVAYSRSPLPF
ncbi:MAG: SirB2 family protein [bacterium]